MAPGTQEDVFSLKEGSVLFQWPERLSASSAKFLKSWLSLMALKIDEAIAAPAKDDDEDEDDENSK